MNNHKNRYILAILLTLTGFALSVNAAPPMITTFTKILKAKSFAFGMFFMIQYLCFSAASFLGNYLKRKRGMSNEVLASIGLFAVSALFMFTQLFINDAGMLIWLIILGLCGGLIETFSTDILAGIEKRGSARLISLSQVFYCAGGIGSPLVVGIFLHFSLPWSWTFIFLGLLILGIGLNFFFVRKRDGIPREEKGGPEEGGVEPRPGERNPFFVLLMVLMFTYTVMEMGAAIWIPFYFEKGKMLAPHLAAVGLSCYWAGMLVGRGLIVVGFRNTGIPRLLLLFLPLCTAAIIITLTASHMIVLMAAAFLFGFGAGPLWPAVVAYSKHLNISSTYTGTIIGIGAVGAAVGPFLGGFFINSLGVGFLFFWFLILSVILVGIATFVHRFAARA